MGNRLALVVAVCLFFSFSALAPAQDFRATISGVVTDSSGSAVPNANVQAIHVANNTTSETKSNASGRYTLPYLDPGVYNIEVKVNGFQTLRREGIVLEVGDKLNLTFQLTVGKVTESVTVTAEQEVIQ